MQPMWKAIGTTLAVVLAATVGCTSRQAPESAPPISRPRVLVFSRTTGFRHDSIPAGVAAVCDLGLRHAFDVDSTDDGAAFTNDSLSRYRVIVFMNTTGDVLDDAQQRALEQFIRNGGGFVGVHSATDTEYDWPWYGRLVGAYFADHPPIQEAVVNVVDRDHDSTRRLPARWERRDEWYNFRNRPFDGIRILATLDESTYVGGSMNNDHPVVWCQEFEGGRSWYTAGGHTIESFSEPMFLEHLLGGIRWAGRIDRAR